MFNLEGKDHAPLLEKFHAPRPLFCAFSRTWVTIVAIFVQTSLCGLMWAFVGVMIVNKTITLPDDLARCTRESPSETNMSITVISTVLGMIVSFLLGITAQHALTHRLSRETRLSTVTAWIQLARVSLFLRPRRHLQWTLLSGLWVVVINFLTTAWSTLLTPESVVQTFTGTGQELDFLNPAVSKYTENLRNLPPIHPIAQNYSLSPENITLSLSLMDDIRKAGRSAAMASIDTRHPSYFNSFNSSTGGVLPAIYINTRLGPKQAEASLTFQGLHEKYKGLSWTYTLVQQGYTANVSCTMSHSPTITLNNTASIKRTFETPSGRRLDYSLQTWSWSTNCSANAEYYTGEVDIIDHSHSRRFVTTGLLATSVCFYQDFSGPSNQSFRECFRGCRIARSNLKNSVLRPVVLMQPMSNSNYTDYFAVVKRNLHTICQVTPTMTTVEVQYNENGTGNVSKIHAQAQLPKDAWHFVLLPGLEIWKAYFLAQGPYSNSMADDIISIDHHNITFVLVGKTCRTLVSSTLADGQGRNTIYEASSSIWAPQASPMLYCSQLTTLVLQQRERAVATYTLTHTGTGHHHLPEDMTIPFNGTMYVHTVGWRFHPRTHSISLAAITLVTGVTAASGMFALMQAKARLADCWHWQGRKPGPGSTRPGIRDPLQMPRGIGTGTGIGTSTIHIVRVALDPTNLMDLLVASSTGSLANALSQCEVEEDRENLRVELTVTDEGQFVLNAC
ncbi:hypothetical protein JVT61DRAFT_4034 [Boletus reticuloceps]|uniref:Uncharacterized protein n=1 Tax=Boletus reticuloceps TaxID=495285 RepID=A0A8I2YMU1_9AGAM|nr:hypothetical protein JVT61DRAFT_4034 [Boletus reticuloceps]